MGFTKKHRPLVTPRNKKNRLDFVETLKYKYLDK